MQFAIHVWLHWFQACLYLHSLSSGLASSSKSAVAVFIVHALLITLSNDKYVCLHTLCDKTILQIWCYVCVSLYVQCIPVLSDMTGCLWIVSYQVYVLLALEQVGIVWKSVCRCIEDKLESPVGQIWNDCGPNLGHMPLKLFHSQTLLAGWRGLALLQCPQPRSWPSLGRPCTFARHWGLLSSLSPPPGEDETRISNTHTCSL